MSLEGSVALHGRIIFSLQYIHQYGNSLTLPAPVVHVARAVLHAGKRSVHLAI